MRKATSRSRFPAFTVKYSLSSSYLTSQAPLFRCPDQIHDLFLPSFLRQIQRRFIEKANRASSLDTEAHSRFDQNFGNFCMFINDCKD
jgi:hypothetical protein